MRTLALLAALLLLALQIQARTLQETADQVPAQNQPQATEQDELWAPDQEQAGDDDQDVAISFTGEERFTRDASEPVESAIKKGCYCRRRCRFTIFGKFFERPSGECKVFGHQYKLCCRH